MPPSAAPEWLRVGWSLEIIATSAPASCASMAARMPAQPAPITSTSWVASMRFGRYTMAAPSGAAEARLDPDAPVAPWTAVATVPTGPAVEHVVPGTALQPVVLTVAEDAVV